MTEGSLTFSDMRRVGLSRSERWHPGGLKSWSLSDWGLAMCGEAGEAANAIKKLNRVRDGLRGNRPGEDYAQLIEKVGDELADTVLYADLTAAAADIDLAAAIIRVFDRKSIEQGFPERLGAPPRSISEAPQ